MRIKIGLFVALALAFALCAPGCKKKGSKDAKKGTEEKAGPEKKEKAAAEEAPAEAVEKATEPAPEAEAEEAAVEPAEAVEAAEAQGTDVVEAGAAAEEPPAVAAPEETEKPVEVAAEEPVEAAVEEPTEAADGAAEEPAEEPAPAGDVVAQPLDVLEADVPEGHYGRPFKLEAMMMLHDVVKHPDHYATFETIKLRGEVLSIVGDLMLLGFRNKDGLWVFLTKFGDGVPSQMELGKTVIVEGKIAPEDWDMDALGSIKMQEGESLEASYKHVLTVEAGSEVDN